MREMDKKCVMCRSREGERLSTAGRWFCQPCTDSLPYVNDSDKSTDIIADLLFAYINKDSDCPHDFEIKAFEDAIYYLRSDQSSKYSLDLFENHLKQMREVIGNE
jgi:hypothetical protein